MSDEPPPARREEKFQEIQEFHTPRSPEGAGPRESGPFGELLGVFRVGRLRVLLYALLGVALMVLGLWGMYVISVIRGRTWLPGWFFVIVIVSASCFLLRQAYLRGRFRVLVYRDAIVRHQGSQVDALPWQRISLVHWVKNPQPDAFETAHRLILETVAEAPPGRSPEGQITIGPRPGFMTVPVSVPSWPEDIPSARGGFTFDGSLGRLRALRQLVEARTLSHLLPAALEAYRAGEVLRFGDLGISPAGLHLPGRTLSWAEVADVREVKDRIAVYAQAGGRAVEQVEVSEVPNAHVLLALVRNRQSEVSDRPSR